MFTSLPGVVPDQITHPPVLRDDVLKDVRVRWREHRGNTKGLTSATPIRPDTGIRKGSARQTDYCQEKPLLRTVVVSVVIASTFLRLSAHPATMMA